MEILNWFYSGAGSDKQLKLNLSNMDFNLDVPLGPVMTRGTPVILSSKSAFQHCLVHFLQPHLEKGKLTLVMQMLVIFCWIPLIEVKIVQKLDQKSIIQMLVSRWWYDEVTSIYQS